MLVPSILQQSPAWHHGRQGFAIQYDEGGSAGQRRAESDGRRRPVPCPSYLHYSLTSDAVRCIGQRSTLRFSNQNLAAPPPCRQTTYLKPKHGRSLQTPGTHARAWRLPLEIISENAAPQCEAAHFTLLFSGNTTVGLKVLASSKSISAYEMMMTSSPTCTLRAAAPLRQMHPVPLSPLMI